MHPAGTLRSTAGANTLRLTSVTASSPSAVIETLSAPIVIVAGTLQGTLRTAAAQPTVVTATVAASTTLQISATFPSQLTSNLTIGGYVIVADNMLVVASTSFLGTGTVQFG